MNPFSRLDRNGGFAALLVFLVPMLLPFGRTAEAPIVIGVFIGALALPGRLRAMLAHPAVRAFTLAAGAYFLAALFSTFDAVFAEKSWTTALASVRLLLFGFGVIALCERAREHGVPARQLGQSLSIAAAVPIAIWTIDALVQVASGHSIGGSLDADRLSGIFGADDLKLGPLLPALAPLLLWPLLQRSRAVLVVAYLLILIVVLLAGSRAGWVSYALVSALIVWRLARGSKRRLAIWGAAALLMATIAGTAAYQLSPSFEARVARTLGGSQADADFALAGRVPIWVTAVRMAGAHPINGVGVRGFRYAYPLHASPADRWVDTESQTGASHAHQLLLELLTETGILGLLFWLVGSVALIRAMLLTSTEAFVRAPWVALGVLAFPFNTHLAFYSSFMGMVLGWLLALACAQSMLFPRETEDGR